MKNLLKSIMILLFAVSCNSETKKKIDGVSKENDRIEKNETPLETEIKKLKKELLKKTLLLDEELLQAFPKNLIGYPLDKVNALPGMAQVYGQFGNGKIWLSISDAAEGRNSIATSFIGSYYYVPPASEKSTNSENSKIERNGIKTISTNKYNETEIQLLFDNRYKITLGAKGMSPEELWQAFDLTSLEEYKKMNK